jgi:hypothetical protein
MDAAFEIAGQRVGVIATVDPSFPCRSVLAYFVGGNDERAKIDDADAAARDGTEVASTVRCRRR